MYPKQSRMQNEWSPTPIRPLSLCSDCCYCLSEVDPDAICCWCSPSCSRFGMFRDAFLLTSFVKSGSLSYCSLPLSSSMSGNSPLTSYQKAYVNTDLGVFCFSHHSVESRDRCVCVGEILGGGFPKWFKQPRRS